MEVPLVVEASLRLRDEVFVSASVEGNEEAFYNMQGQVNCVQSGSSFSNISMMLLVWVVKAQEEYGGVLLHARDWSTIPSSFALAEI
jgi:hypothetical protein